MSSWNKYLANASVVLMVLMVSAVCRAEGETPPQAWLDGMARAFRELNYDISFVYMRDGMVEPMRLVHALDNGRERERVVHLNGQPREIIREDDSVVAYFPNRAPLVLDKPQTPTMWTRTLVDNLNQMHRFYQLIDRGNARIAGREAKQIDVHSIDGNRYGYRLWIDVDSGLLLRSDLVDAREHILEQWQVMSLQLLSVVPEESLKVSFVTPSVNPGPPGVVAHEDVTNHGPSGFDVGWLPDGFVLKSRQWQRAQKVLVEHLLFSDGVAAISVYIGAPLPENMVVSRVYSKGAMTIYESGNAQSHVTVVGDVPTQIAKQIALSVKRSMNDKPAAF